MPKKNATQYRERKLSKTLEWFSIPLWILITIILIQTNTISEFLPSLSAESINTVILLFLLAPICFVALLLTYGMDWSLFGAKTAQLTQPSRLLLSLFATGIILIASWYLVLIVSFALPS